MSKKTNVFAILTIMLGIAVIFPVTVYAQPLNNWLEFDGTDDYVDVADDASLNSSSFTVEFWLNPDILRVQHCIYKKDPGGGGLYWRIFMNAYDEIEFDAKPGEIANCQSGNVVQAGQWIHIAAVYDNAAETAKIYANGELKSTVTGISDMGGGSNKGMFLSGPSYPLDGHMDDVRFWSVARTETEIQDNMNLHLTGTETGLAAYWKLNETSSTTADDATTNSNDGTLINMSGNEWISIFSEVSAGLTGVYYSSTAWGDYDNDGDLDILLTGNTGSAYVSKIYRNDGVSGFIEQTGISLADVKYSSVDWGDYDNDGDLDILLTGATGSVYVSKIYRNDGVSGFIEQTGISLADVKYSSVAWGDYDNDGDLDILLTGSTGSAYISKIYRNDGVSGFIEQTSISLTGVYHSSVAWGDYDNDGDLDILLTGYSNSGRISRIYNNDGNGGFTNSGISLTGVNYASVAWGDYDNDGDLDILLTGLTSSSRVSQIYNNDGNGGFTNSGISLTGMSQSSSAWGDYDNDGDLDILLTGYDGSARVSKIYKNNGSGVFEEQTDISFTGVNEGSVAWGDYDNDGDLDILLTGWASGPGVSKIYQNNNAVSNTLPEVPTNLSSSLSGSDITLSWDAATDNETPSAGLNYNIRVGTTPGGSDVVGPMANTTNGYRRVPALGNTNLNTSMTIKGLPGGNYNWSVQTIDNTFSGSGFASEGLFAVTGIPDSIPGYALDFDGIDDYVDVADDASLTSSSFTTEFWLKPDVLRTQHCIYKKNPGGGGLSWRIFMSGTGGAIEFDALPGEIANCRTGNVAEAGKWVHIAASYDQTAQTVRIYANGVLQETVTGIPDMGGGSDKGSLFSNPASPLDGKMDEVRFWNVARTEQQIRENMHKTLTQSETGLVGYWQLNESSGTVAGDSYWSNNGTLINMADEDWVESTVSTGGGVSNTQTETSGVVAFTGTNLEMNFSAHNSASITVTKINNRPNGNPSFITFDDQYWVVNRFGSGSFDTNLTFTVNENLTALDESDPSQIKLYSRTSTADGSWSLVTSAVSVNSAANSATFDNISSFSQFILCREIMVNNFSGNALDFDGADDYVETTLDDLSGSEITIEYWFKGSSTQSAIRQQSGSDYIVSGWSDTHILSNDGGAGNGIPVGSGAEDGNWHHIAMSWKQNTTNGFVSYLDGEIVGQRTSNNTPIPNINANIIFGSCIGTSEFINGSLDEVRIWNVVCDSVQIRENMHLSLSGLETGLVSYWQMNEGDGAVTYDCSSNNTGTLNNMDNSDWIGSTIPFGGGVADSQTETPGLITFTGTGLSIDFDSVGIAEITVSRIDTLANINPTEPGEVFDTQYWVVNRYGTGTFAAYLTFSLSEDLTTADEADPTQIKLYTRGSNADVEWIELASANSVVAATDEATFWGITGFSQFIIGRLTPQSIDTPQNVTIEIIGTDVQLTWDEVSGANSYKIYASDDPYAVDWGTAIASISGTSWSETIPGNKKFYRVVASTEMLRGSIRGFGKATKRREK